MFKKTILASVIAAASFSAAAEASYYVVVPIPGKASLINGIAVALGTLTLPTATMNQPYAGVDLRTALTVTGDPDFNAAYVGWSVVTGALPAGLTLNKGIISGTPTVSGESAFTVRATYKTKTGAQGYTLITVGITVGLAAATLPEGVAGAVYPPYDLKPLLAVVGDASFTPASATWTVVSSTLPAGLTLRTDGTIAGTPATAGTGSITARASYRGVNGEQTYQVVTLGITVTLAAGTPQQAILGQVYSYDLKPLLNVAGDAAYAGTGVTWTVVASTLPVGLLLRADGTIGGTPTSAGTQNITVRASYRGLNGEQTYQIVTLNIVVALAPLVIPAAQKGAAYAGYDFKNLLTVTGDATYTAAQATFTGMALPAGMSLSTTGVLSGTPTIKNSAGASFQVTAAYRTKTGQRAYTIVVDGVPLQVTSIAAGYNYTCAITTEGGAKCWGGAHLGDGTVATSSVPVQVSGLTSGVTSIAAGYEHTCAVVNGAAMCWGYNAQGKLGNGTWDQTLVPGQVSGLTSGVTSISAGGNHTCAVVSGAAKCWGYNSQGQLGDGTWNQTLVPVQVSGLTSGVTSIAAGDSHTCAVVSGAAKCWGYGASGRLGDGTSIAKSLPTQVSGLTTGVTSISVGYSHTCAVVNDAAKCWGSGASGGLGDGTTVTKLVPTQVSGLTSGVTSIAAGANHTCAVVSGAASCWGTNAVGQAGDGTTEYKLVPTQVSGLTSGVTTITAGSSHTCAVVSGGAKCWGSNGNGWLGDGTAVNRLTPVSAVGEP